VTRETCIQIVDWDAHYENNRTRELKKMAWVPMPNSHDGDGYTQLLSHPNGAAHFGAWCALVEVASRCEPRGTLLRKTVRIPQEGAVIPQVPAQGVREARESHNSSSLARMTRIPEELWDEVLPRLVSIGWIRYYTIPQEGAVIPQVPAEIPQDGAQKGRERKKEGKGEKGTTAPPAAAALTAAPQVTSVDGAIAALRTVNRNTTLQAVDQPAFSAILAAYALDQVLAAYADHQRRKPGKSLHWFLVDFHEHLERVLSEPSKKPSATEPPATADDRLAAREREEAEHPELVAEAEAKAAELKAKMKGGKPTPADDDWEAVDPKEAGW
jgi:hypothetical protein